MGTSVSHRWWYPSCCHLNPPMVWFQSQNNFSLINVSVHTHDRYNLIQVSLILQLVTWNAGENDTTQDVMSISHGMVSYSHTCQYLVNSTYWIWLTLWIYQGPHVNIAKYSLSDAISVWLENNSRLSASEVEFILDDMHTSVWNVYICVCLSIDVYTASRSGFHINIPTDADTKLG